MRISYLSSVRNDLLQDIVDNLIPPFGESTRVPVSIFYQSTFAPHAPTTRNSYTPAANKRVVITHIDLAVRRVTAAAVASFYRVIIAVDQNSSGDIDMWRIIDDTNTAGFEWHKQITPFIALEAGDTIKIITHDISTGGTVMYDAVCSGFEYDV